MVNKNNPSLSGYPYQKDFQLECRIVALERYGRVYSDLDDETCAKVAKEAKENLKARNERKKAV